MFCSVTIFPRDNAIIVRTPRWITVEYGAYYEQTSASSDPVDHHVAVAQVGDILRIVLYLRKTISHSVLVEQQLAIAIIVNITVATILNLATTLSLSLHDGHR